MCRTTSSKNQLQQSESYIIAISTVSIVWMPRYCLVPSCNISWMTVPWPRYRLRCTIRAKNFNNKLTRASSKSNLEEAFQIKRVVIGHLLPRQMNTGSTFYKFKMRTSKNKLIWLSLQITLISNSNFIFGLVLCQRQARKLGAGIHHAESRILSRRDLPSVTHLIVIMLIQRRSDKILI